MSQQIELTREALATAPQNSEQLAAGFKRKPIKAVDQVVHTLAALGLIQQGQDEQRWHLQK